MKLQIPKTLVLFRAAHRNRKLTVLRPGFTGDHPYRWTLKVIVLRAVMLTANYRKTRTYVTVYGRNTGILPNLGII
jgi:hypothetical protein